MASGILADLERIVGSDGVTNRPDRMSRYSGDALRSFRALRSRPFADAVPGAVVWPESIKQISDVLRFAQQRQIPVVPYGGGTGVFGAASAMQDCIVLSLDRMDSVLALSKDDSTAQFQSGIVLEDAAHAVYYSGMQLGHDPWSRPIATVGGAISTNGVGYTAAGHGSIGDQVLGIEAVLADGEIIRTRASAKQTNGLDLNQLLIGTEGTFGVVANATLRVFPQPEKRLLATVDFPTFEAGFLAICRLYSEGVRPTVIDYGTESTLVNGTSDDDEATLYIGFDGFAEDVKVQWTRTLDISRNYDGQEGSRDEASRFWAARHSSGERYKRDVLESRDPAEARRGRPSAEMDYFHVSLPVSQVLRYRDKCKRIFEERGASVKEWSIWARPEFFSFLISQEDGYLLPTTQETESVVDEVLTIAQQMGGSMEYCHGVGLKLAHLAEAEHGNGLKIMRQLKKSVDPNHILNPGKILG